MSKVMEETEVERLTRLLKDTRRELISASAERDVLRDQLEGNIPKATYWLQGKVWRQREMLNRHTKRATAHRAVLHRLDQLGRGLTYDEWVELRDELSSSAARAAYELLEWVPPTES